MLKPLQDFMIIKLVEEQKSSIIVPQTVDKTKSESALFEVEAVGPGYWEEGRFHDSPVKPGNKVVVAGFSLAKIKYRGEDILVARARDVALVVTDEGEEVKK